MGTDGLPVLSRLWKVHLEASFAAWRIFDGLLSRSLDARLAGRDQPIDEREHCVETEYMHGVARGQRFGEAEEAIQALAMGLRGGKVQRLEAMIHAIDHLQEERSNYRPAPHRRAPEGQLTLS